MLSKIKKKHKFRLLRLYPVSWGYRAAFELNGSPINMELAFNKKLIYISNEYQNGNSSGRVESVPISSIKHNFKLILEDGKMPRVHDDKLFDHLIGLIDKRYKK